MKIYLAIKFHPDNQNRPLIEAISKRLSDLGHSTICAVRDFENWGEKQFEPAELLQKSFNAIEESDLVLIEATEKGMGVGIEAGFAFAKNVPIVTIAQSKVDLSINLQSLSRKTLIYSHLQEIVV